MSDYIQARVVTDDIGRRWVSVTDSSGREVGRMTPGAARDFHAYFSRLVNEAYQEGGVP